MENGKIEFVEGKEVEQEINKAQNLPDISPAEIETYIKGPLNAEFQPVELPSTFGDKNSFEHGQRVALMLSKSDLIPDAFKGNVQNIMIALELANRIGASPLMIMQNLHIIYGKPSFSSSFIISAINSCGRFSPLRFEKEGEGETLSCYCWAYDIKNNEKCVGPKVTFKMAVSEGWTTKKGSKWGTMPELMIMYRSAAFFGRLFAPEILMGMQTTEEVNDVQIMTAEAKQSNIENKLNKILK